MSVLGLASPWITFYREIETLFKEDPGVRVIYDQDENAVRLYVEDSVKADALTQLLPTERTFGNVTVSVEVIPANKILASCKTNLFRAAFKDNPALSFIQTINGIFTNEITYVVFVNKVVQYHNDSLADVYGQCSTLYQELAKDIFGESEGIFFCTDKAEEMDAKIYYTHSSKDPFTITCR